MVYREIFSNGCSDVYRPNFGSKYLNENGGSVGMTELLLSSRWGRNDCMGKILNLENIVWELFSKYIIKYIYRNM